MGLPLKTFAIKMKKLVPILFAVLMIIPSACVKDDLDACAGILRVYFSYIYGGTNEFYSTVNTNVHLGFYHRQSNNKYREVEIDRSSIGINSPWMFEKVWEDQDSVTLISWTHDDRLEYITDEHSGPEQSYVRLKRITESGGICSPVEDLFYGKAIFDAGLRINRNDVTIQHERAVCRMRVTLIPKTVQKTSDLSYNAPDLNDYTFHIFGTLDRINYNNETSGEDIVLSPKPYYNEADGNITTKWFGAFSSPEGTYLKVNVYHKGVKVASFDCSEIQLASIPGRTIDICIDGKYISPEIKVLVNGWEWKPVINDM